MATLLVALRFLCLVVGGTALLIGVFVGHNGRGMVRSVVLDFWVTLTSFGEEALSRHVRLVRGTARAALIAIEWVFGKKLLSLRCAWAVGMLSLCSLAIAFFSAVGFVFRGLAHQSSWVPKMFTTERTLAMARMYPFLFLLGGLFSLALFIAALWPALLSWPWSLPRVLIALLPFLLVQRRFVGILYLLIDPGLDYLPGDAPAPAPAPPPPSTTYTPGIMLLTYVSILIWPVLVVCSDLTVLAITRWALRKCQTAEKWRSGLAALLTLLSSVFIMSGLPVYLLRHVGAWYVTLPTLILSTLVPTNLFDVLLTAALATWVLVLVLHKLLWPLCSGLVEHAYELIPSRLAMITAGVGLLTLGGWTSIANLISPVLVTFGAK